MRTYPTCPTCPTCHKNTEVRPGAYVGRWVCICGASFGSIPEEFHPLFPGAECSVSPTTENSGTIGEAIVDDPADRMGAIIGEITLNGPCPSSTPETNALKEQIEVLRQMRDEAIEEMGKLAAERDAALVDSSHTLTALHAAQQTIKLLHPALEKCLSALRLRRNTGFPTYDALAMEAEKQGDTAFASILLPK